MTIRRSNRFSFAAICGTIVILSIMSVGGCNPVGNVTLTTVDLTPVTPETPPISRADLNGKVVLMNFWATWCGPCVREFPELMRVTSAHRNNKEFVFLSVSSSHPSLEENRRQTVGFLSREGYQIPVYADPHNATRTSLAAVAPTDGIPLTVLFDRDGKVVKSIYGFIPAEFEELKLMLASMLQ